MSTAYTFVRSVSDEDTLFAYLRALYPSLVASSFDGTAVRLGFSAALTGPQQTALNAQMLSYVDPAVVEDRTDANVSAFNSSSSALAGSAAFQGTWEDCSRFSSVRVSALSNAASAADGLSVQFGVLSPQADVTQTYTAEAGTSLVAVNAIAGRYVRVMYTNGATAQSSFALCTRWSRRSEAPIVQASARVADDSDCSLTRALMHGRYDSDAHGYSHMRLDEQSRLRVRVPCNFERQQAVSNRPYIQESFTYGVSADSTITTLVGAGTVTSSASRAVVASGAAINTSARLATDRLTTCAPGTASLMIASAAFTAGIAGNTQVVGGGNLVNGLFFGFNGTSFGVAVRSNSVTAWIPQASWNVDALDGTGPSGVTLNPLFGNTYAVSYGGMGYGCATFMVMAPAAAATNPSISLDDFIAVHRESFANTSASVGVLNPQFPLTAISANTTATTAVPIYVAGFCAFAEAEPSNAVMYALDANRSITAIAAAPILTLMNNATLGGVTNMSTVMLRSLSVAIIAGTRLLWLMIIRNPTQTNLGTMVNVGASSCVSYSVAAAATVTDTTGVTVYGIAINTGQYTVDLTPYNIYMSPGSKLCFSCSMQAAGTNLTAIAVTWSETQ
ncbi:hypothetical protein JKP88DRAFT_273082 [Tribonema minus]|uniref:Uncharacterized protein n=1 Tax=Tribonema minus TaxID=303371 RepID=A0A835YWS2_9STRA|nr:hypothetical protein JKP88DRAFT_273082 [Tribonema minus]